MLFTHLLMVAPDDPDLDEPLEINFNRLVL